MTKKDVLEVNADDILTTGKTGGIYLNKIRVTDQELHTLQEEAAYLKGTRLWGILTSTLKDQAKQVMFEKAQSFDDMRMGKAMLHNIGVQENIVTILTKNMPVINRKISLTN